MWVYLALIISVGVNCYLLYPLVKSKLYPSIRNGVLHRDVKHVKGNIYGLRT